MSGGIGFVLDADGTFSRARQRTRWSAWRRSPTPIDVAILRDLVERHAALTESGVARRLLADWDASLGRFVKVMPNDLRRVLAERAEQDEGLAVAGD